MSDDMSIFQERDVQKQLLELDIDVRLAQLWQQLDDVHDVDDRMREVVSAFMRAAYGSGYIDALTEPTRGKLCRDNGYKAPVRRPQTASDRHADLL